jgi:phosphatidylserine/phosphatidylglycerophosphate/cardiolipin synthase-like enzyme
MIDTCDFSYLISILEAVSLYNRVHMDKDEVEVVLTVPEQPSRLVEVMPHQGPYFAKLGATDSAFMKIARDATRRLVIASPFIDKAGAEWIVNLFNLTADKEIERYLIFRDYDSIKTYLMPHADLIKQLSIKLCDYFIHHEDRNPPYETFHAKMVLGDDTRAYVGSANMLGSSLAVCLEVGVVMKGKSVLDIKRLIDSMIEVAKIVE